MPENKVFGQSPLKLPPSWPRLVQQDRTALMPTVEAVSLARKARGCWDDYVRSKSSGNQRRLGVRMTTWEVSRLETNENWVLE